MRSLLERKEPNRFIGIFLEERNSVALTPPSPQWGEGKGEGVHILNMAIVKECKKKTVRKPKRKTLSLKERRKGFAPVDVGLLREEAVKEAQRCLGLRECESCEICSLFCPDLCITRDEKTGEVRIDLDYCKGCGICATVCPKGAIQMVLEEGI